MLRRPLIALSHSRKARQFVTSFPPAWRVARRFVAGETRDQALAVIHQLNDAGMSATVDYLGEHVTERSEATTNVDEYVAVLGEIAAHSLRSGVSLKPSAMGLHIDAEFCYENVRRVVAAAHQAGSFVRIDIEESALVDVTLALYRRLRQEFPNVGMAIQAYLFRTKDDVRALIDEGIADLRLVKGAYDEPATIAWREREAIRREMIDICKMLLAPEARAKGARLALGSHDDVIYNQIVEYAASQGIDSKIWEIQFLHGIRRDEQKRLVQAGQRMRIYVPYGKSWYPYFMRRLAERPANLFFFMRALVGE